MQRICELEAQIRELINRPRRHTALRQNPALFSQLCSCLDVLGDTGLALREYLARERAAISRGDRYLLTYGVLQALILQQDAVEHLAESLGVVYERAPELKEIRDIRHNAVGHPTKRRRPRGSAFNHISRFSMKWKGFDLITFLPSGDYRKCEVDLISLIECQHRLLSADLQYINEVERAQGE